MEKLPKNVLTFGLRRLRLSRLAKAAKLDIVMDAFYRRHPERLEYQRKLAREAREEERAAREAEKDR